MSEAEKWAIMVQDFKESGKSQRIFSSDKGIKRSSLILKMFLMVFVLESLLMNCFLG